MRLVLFLFAAFSASLALGQGSPELFNEESDGLVGGVSDLMLYTTVKSGPEEISGNPFLYEGWNNQGVVYSEGVAYNISKLNYNMYSDEIAELKTANEVFVFDKAAIDSLVISGRQFKKLNGAFYEMLAGGSKMALLKQHTTRVQKGQFNPTDGTTTPSRLVRMDDYFTYSDGKIQKYKPSKSNMVEVFGDKESEIKKLIKDEKLSHKNEEDLKRVFNYYNGL